MKLAFSGQSRFADYEEGYQLYLKRLRGRTPVDFTTYKRIVRAYCRMLAERLYDEGMADFPNGMGSVCTALLRRRPQYRGKTFIGLGKMDWEKGHYDGSYKAFGLVFMPNRNVSNNLRCYGFVGNRQLFKKLKAEYDNRECDWFPMEYKDEMI